MQVAAKGKKQNTEALEGQVSSFDGTILIFRQGQSGLYLAMDTSPGTAQTSEKQVSANDSEMVIVLGGHLKQAPVDPGHIADSYDIRTKDVDLLRAEAERAKGRLAADFKPLYTEDAERDLTNCKVRGHDWITEKDPESSDSDKAPVRGTVKEISGGYVKFQSASDVNVSRYRLDELSEIIIGTCP